MSETRQRRPMFGAFSFVFLYSWYNVFWRYFDNSPVAPTLWSAGMIKEDLMAVISICAVIGVAVSMWSVWIRMSERRGVLLVVIHLLAFLPFQMFTLFSAAPPIYALGVIGGFCIGTIVGRSFYSMFFEIMYVHPAKVIVVGYTIIQAYILITDNVPLGGIPPLYYGLEAATLLAGLVLSFFRRDVEEMRIRRILPEIRFHLKDIWPLLAMIALLDACPALYDAVLLHGTVRTPFTDAVKIIPVVLRLVFLALFGKKIPFKYTFMIFLGLYTCSIGTYVLLGPRSRIPGQFFMEFAYIVLNVLLIWVLKGVFYTYGRSQLRLRICIIVFFVVRFGTIVICDYLVLYASPSVHMAFFALLPAFLAALIIPATDRVIKSMEAQRAYAEQQQELVVPLPPERAEVVAARDSLMQLLPADVALTEDEQTTLTYLIDGQPLDVTAYFMGMSHHNIAKLNKEVFKKLGVESAHELMVLLGSVSSGEDSQEQREELFRQHGLTTREKEVCGLLLKNLSIRQISGDLGLSFDTVNGYYRSLYRKLNINSKAELFMIFGADVV